MSPEARTFLVGVDEAGRGPIAGPVAVGAVSVPKNFRFPSFIRDSKQLTEKAREEAFLWMKGEPALSFSVTLVGSARIDALGITRAVAYGVRSSLLKLELDGARSDVKLDGLLRAPARFERQETIKRGDSIEPVIAAASIAAKVVRDRKMKRLAKLFPEYGFELHKGYGTRAHYEHLNSRGLSEHHRLSFLSRFLEKS